MNGIDTKSWDPSSDPYLPRELWFPPSSSSSSSLSASEENGGVGGGEAMDEEEDPNYLPAVRAAKAKAKRLLQVNGLKRNALQSSQTL